MSLSDITAIIFDTYGTVVDWRRSVAAEGRALAAAKGNSLGAPGGIDWEAFANAWRAGYEPAMDMVRKGQLPWTTNDTLQRRHLDVILEEFHITGLSEAEKDDFNRAWHRLQPWPDAVAGLTRLKKIFTIGTLSNGSFFLLANMAKHAGLPWDCIISADNFHHYKPDPEIYLGAIELLGGDANRIMLAAAHNYDLKHARRHGMKTAFIARPTEYGPDQDNDLSASQDWDIITDSINGIAEALGV